MKWMVRGRGSARWSLSTLASLGGGRGFPLAVLLEWLLCLGLALGLVLPATAQLAPTRVEGLAVLVGGSFPGPGVTVLLRSDVVFRAQMHLFRRGAADLQPGGALLRAAQDELIGEVLIANEADRMQIARARPSDVAAERRRLVESLGGEAALDRLLRMTGASQAEVDNATYRRATVAAFLGANLDGEGTVTEMAVDAALQAQGHAMPQAATPAERAQVRQALSKEGYRRAVQRWVRVLRSRTVVRILSSYGAPS